MKECQNEKCPGKKVPGSSFLVNKFQREKVSACLGRKSVLVGKSPGGKSVRMKSVRGKKVSG